MDLDTLLNASAEPVATRTSQLRREMQRLVAETELLARPARRRLKGLVVAGAAAGALTIGTAGAMAAGIVPGPAWVGSWTTASGQDCYMEFSASAGGIDGEPLGREYTPEQKAQALELAQSYLASFDVASVDKDAAIRAWQRGEDAAIANAPVGEEQPRLHGDELEITAVGQVVARGLGSYLTTHGLSSDLVVFGQGWRCDR